ncbi:hypothetical protein K435DRAFT_670546, partial [Dendrothele bispora CBS 962.96]
DLPLKEWIPYRDEYLAELLHLEGRGDFSLEVCPVCGLENDEEIAYRCLDCLGGDLKCQDCCVKEHQSHPLHIIEKWNGVFFEEVSLKSLGLVVQLGHHHGSPCSDPRFTRAFTVIHVNGIHDVCVGFCNCENKGRAGEWREQLLHRRWYPATHLNPRTCTTMEALNHFHVMTLQGKVTTYDYYNGLEKLRNNVGLKKQKDRYKPFSRSIRQFRHLKLLKRSGRGNDATRPVELTEKGELAIRCPACPWEGVNLPKDWKDGPEAQRFKFWLFLAIDACFRLKRRQVSSEGRDPALGGGWGYFVEWEPYRRFLLSVTDQQELSTCSGLSTLTGANRDSRGYASTGVNLGVCARHEFVQANGAGDLQKGERYVNMDYICASILRHHYPGLTKVFSYDIACQWSVHLAERLLKLPPLLRLNLIFHIVYFVVPKLHIYGHQLRCQLLFLLNWLWGAGRTDGEGIERPWAHMGPVATSTRDMGPGSRQDTLDDHFGHWNFIKLVGLGKRIK